MPITDAYVQMYGNALFRNAIGSFPTAVFMGLFTTAPTTTAGAGYVELTTVPYSWYTARIALPLGAPVGRVFSSNGAVLFTSNATVVVPVPVAYFGVFTSATIGAGALVAYGNLATPISIGIGSQVNFPAGQIVFADTVVT